MLRSFFLILALPMLVLAQPQGFLQKVIPVGDRKAIVDAAGMETFVTGKIASAQWSSSGKVLIIRFEESEKSKFQVFMLERMKKQMDESFKGDFAATITGKNVKIRGRIQPYGGHDESLKDWHELQITAGSAITILDPVQTP